MRRRCVPRQLRRVRMLTPDAGTQAARLAERYRMAVMPLPPGGRTPAGPRQIITTPAQIRQVWQQDPTANMGVLCRPSGLVVLDIDGEQGRRSWQAARTAHGEPQEEADTLTVATPHGRHIYYQAPPGATIPSTSGGRTPLGPGIDTRAPGRHTGGYVIGPGSVVQGRPYRIITDRPPAPLPGWVTRALTRPRLRRRPPRIFPPTQQQEEHTPWT